MKIAYVEHPVSKEEKKMYLTKKGFDRILDAKFAPEKLGDGDKVFTKPKQEEKKEEK